MILVDMNQIGVASVMMHLNITKRDSVDVPLVRHMILNSLRMYRHKFNEEYGELVICYDSRHYWRRDFFPEYKASRKKTRETSGHNWSDIFECLNTVKDELIEFFPYKVLEVYGAEADDILAGNDFRNIALVTDPTTYGTSTVASATTYRQVSALKLTSQSGTFTVDEKISQASTGAIGKVVEWDSTLGILYYQQERYADYGTISASGSNTAFSGANAVTGASSSAAGTPDSTADTAVTLANDNTITFTDGYANPELQPDSGNIIYQENRKPISRATDQTEDIKIIVEF